MEENVFPLSRAAEDQMKLEEERRLAYAWGSRGQKVLFLIMPTHVCSLDEPATTGQRVLSMEISSDLLTCKVSQSANTSFKASYSNGGGTTFGKGMSLPQALQE